MILSRNTNDRFSVITKEWFGKFTALIGGGPSVTAQDIQLLKQLHDRDQVNVIAINDSYLIAPWSDVCYFADHHWYERHKKGVAKPTLGLSAKDVKRKFAGFSGLKCSIQNPLKEKVPEDSVHVLRNATHPYNSFGFSKDPIELVTGHNGGFQALNFSVLAGSKIVALLGYDGRMLQDKTHWHGDHGKATAQDAYEVYRRSFSAGERLIADAGVRVYNCSLNSAINSFPKMKLEQVIELSKAH